MDREPVGRRGKPDLRRQVGRVARGRETPRRPQVDGIGGRRDRPVVTAAEERPSRSHNVRERSTVDADLEHATVITNGGALEGITLTERKHRPRRRDRNRVADEQFVRHRRAVRAKRRVRCSIAARGAGHPKSTRSRLGARPTGRQRGSHHAVEVLPVRLSERRAAGVVVRAEVAVTARVRVTRVDATRCRVARIGRAVVAVVAHDGRGNASAALTHFRRTGAVVRT